MSELAAVLFGAAVTLLVWWPARRRTSALDGHAQRARRAPSRRGGRPGSAWRRRVARTAPSSTA